MRGLKQEENGGGGDRLPKTAVKVIWRYRKWGFGRERQGKQRGRQITRKRRRGRRERWA